MRFLLKSPWRIIAFLAVTALLLLCMIPWSPMCRSEHDLNLVSGRTRVIYRVAFLPMRETVEETELSLIVNKPDDDAQWVRVCTFSPGVSHSPHHIYHSAENSAYHLGNVFKETKWSPEAKRLVAEHFLKRLRDDGNDRGATDFAYKVMESTFSGRSVGLADAERLIQAQSLPGNTNAAR